MRADLILNDANLKKCETNPVLKECKIIGSGFDYSVRKLFLYLEHLDIKFELSTDNHIIIGQIDFFKLVDFIALLRLRTTELQVVHMCSFRCLRSDFLTTIAEYFHFTEYDVQPFRTHLFEAANATTEICSILKVLNATNKNCFINNYDNSLEMDSDIARNFLEVLAHWIEDFEYYTERML